jgi:hypothetical protein
LQNDNLAGLPASLRTDGGANKVYGLKSEAILDLAIVCHYARYGEIRIDQNFVAFEDFNRLVRNRFHIWNDTFFYIL